MTLQYCLFWSIGPICVMGKLSATNAKNRFGELVDMAQAEPVRIQRHGRDVAVVLSPAEFARLLEMASGSRSPASELPYAESRARWIRWYEELRSGIA